MLNIHLLNKCLVLLKGKKIKEIKGVYGGIIKGLLEILFVVGFEGELFGEEFAVAPDF